MKRFLESIKEQPLVLSEWDEQLWKQLVESVTLYHDGRAVFVFAGGTEITVM